MKSEIIDRPLHEAAQSCADTFALADWRRRLAELYAAVRAEADPRAAWDLWRKVRDDLFCHHSQSPIQLPRRLTYAGIPLYDYDPAWRFLVRWEPVLGQSDLKANGGADGAIRLKAFARTIGLARRLGQELTIYWIEGYGGGLFLPFKDATSGKETYAGGRYLLDGIKGADLGLDPDGRLIIDFNFAYHPSCCHSHSWICPLATPENHLGSKITAGERL